jgi:hypothetical protein
MHYRQNISSFGICEQVKEHVNRVVIVIYEFPPANSMYQVSVKAKERKW